MLDPEILKKEIVMVTGHTRFKGAWLSIWLNQLSANVRDYALEQTVSWHKACKQKNDMLKIGIGRINDYQNARFL